MSSKIDDRIVNMKFNNSQFEKGVAQTSSSLGKLEKALEMAGVGKNVENIASKFSAFGAIAFSALQRLTNAAIDFGQQIAGAVLDPLIEGGQKRALNIEQAKFQFKGLGMDVEQSMEDALFAVKDTAFGLDEAAVAASQFGASGIQSGDDMKSALRGISGVAAMAGSSYSDMANVFTKVAGQGRLMGDDLNRLGTRGINAAATLAEYFNKTGEAVGATEADIREMVTKGKIDFKTFAAAMSDAFGEHATKANETYTGSLANMRAAISRVGASFFAVNFEGQRRIFNALTPAIDNVKKALDPVVEFFAELKDAQATNIERIFKALNFSEAEGQLPPLFQGLKNIVDTVLVIGRAIRDAFNEIFPPATEAQIKGMAASFQAFTERLMLSDETGEQIKRTFKGLFAVFDIVGMAIGGVFRVLGSLFGLVSSGGGGFFGLTASIGDFLVNLRDAIREGNIFTRFFGALQRGVERAGEAIRNFFGIFKREQSEAAESVGDQNPVSNFFDKIAEAFRQIKAFFQPVIDWLMPILKTVGGAIRDFFGSLDGNMLIGLLNAGLLTGVIFAIQSSMGGLRGLVDRFVEGIKGIGAGMGEVIKGTFGELTNTLKTMQAQLKSDILIKIAIAIGILTASVIALSFVDTGRLAISLGAMAVMFGQLMGALTVFEKVTTMKGAAKLPLIAAGLIVMAGAMVIFAAALAIMAALDWDGLAVGLTGMTTGLLLMVTAAELLSRMSPKMAMAAPGMIAISTAMAIMGGAMHIFAALDWDQILRGLSAMTGAMGLVLAASAIAKKVTGGAASMFLVSAALTVLGAALTVMATLSWDEILRALATLAGSLILMTLAIRYMQGAVAGAAAFFIISVALTALAGALKIFATFSWDEILRSLVVLAGSLAILAGAMALMGLGPVMLGSVALMVASVALMALAPALKILGSMSWDDIGRGLALLASSLAIIAVGGLLLIPAIPGLLALGIAAGLIGVGALAAGVGMTLMATGFAALAAAASVGAAGIKMALLTLISVIPDAMKAFAQGIIDFAVVIAEGGAEFTGAMSTLLSSLIDSIHENGPKIIDTLWDLLMQMIDKLEENVPKMVDSGMKLLKGVLRGIGDNIGGVADEATKIITEFIHAIGRNADRVIRAGADTIIDFINGVSNTIDTRSEELGRAGGRLASSIVRGMVNGLGAGIEEVVNGARNLAGNILGTIANVLGTNSPSREAHKLGVWFDEGMINGLKAKSSQITKTSGNIGSSALQAVRKSLDGIKSAVASDMDFQPTIRPVVDLSNLRQSDVNSIFAKSFSVQGQYATASSISGNVRAADEWRFDDDNPDNGPREVKFEQRLYSPKALTPAEIYRQTNNLISQAKKELKK